MAWQLWLLPTLAIIGFRFYDWLDAYRRLSIPYMILIWWSFEKFFLYLAERA